MKLASVVIAVTMASSLLVGHALASDDKRMSHYKGEASPTLEVAIHNLTTFNQQLEAILESDEIDIRKISEIHELTYTLERALERLEEELEEVAETLEKVHVGSERAQVEQVRTAGKAYLEHVRQLFPQTQK